MSHSVETCASQTDGPSENGSNGGETLRCPLPARPQRAGAFTAEQFQILDEAGCPLVSSMQERLRFEALLAEVSATFVNLTPREVDAHISGALERIVAFLGIDRGGLAELLVTRKQMVITHAYHSPGVPPLPRMILDEQLPWYTRSICRGEVLRFRTLPDELPPEAVQERLYCSRIGLKSHVMIPLSIRDQIVGAIGFGSFRGYRDWSEELIRSLRLVGEIFSNALARKQADEALVAREQSLQQTREGLRQLAARLLHAQEEERRHIAREMHDDWAQRLALLSIDLARLESSLGAPEKALPMLRTMQQQLVELSKDVHLLSRQLHPSILEDLGLVAALRSECAGFAQREGIEIHFQSDEAPAGLPRDHALGLYRVAQEALRNLAKHAAVKEAWVTLSCTQSDLRLRIEDKGNGFDPVEARSRHGLGLTSMEERGRLIQASLAIVSAPGQGTTVEMQVPLARRES